MTSMANILMDKADILAAAFSNETFKAEAKDLKTLAELQALLEKYNVFLTEEEVSALCEQVAKAAASGEDGELDEDSLENVTGGAWWYIPIAIVCIGGFCLGIYNGLND